MSVITSAFVCSCGGIASSNASSGDAGADGTMEPSTDGGSGEINAQPLLDGGSSPICQAIARFRNRCGYTECQARWLAQCDPWTSLTTTAEGEVRFAQCSDLRTCDGSPDAFECICTPECPTPTASQAGLASDYCSACSTDTTCVQTFYSTSSAMAARLFVIESDVVIDELRKRCAPDGGAIDCARFDSCVDSFIVSFDDIMSKRFGIPAPPQCDGG